jgi:translation initiation factor IF-3
MDKKSIEYNEKIKSNIIKLIDENGQMIGEITKAEALKIAEERELDVVICAATAVPPVAKLCHLDKYIFEQTKKEKENKKNNKQMEFKKIKIGIHIDQNDLKTKLRQAEAFLEDRNQVTFFMRFKRKDFPNAEKGMEILKQAAMKLENVGQISKEVSMEKNVASLILQPVKKKV